MLAAPQSGERILSWAQQATKEINSNIVHNGIGIKVTRGPNGTNISTTANNIQPSLTKRQTMPFDCQLVSHEDDSMAFEVHVLCGKLFYGIENGITEIQPEDLIGKDFWDLNLSLADQLTIGIICNYDEEAETTIPESFTVGEIPSDPAGGGSVSDGGWMDANGLHCFPLVRFIKTGPDTEYKGPYIFSIKVPTDEEGGESSGTEEEPKFDTYYAIQSHHGDVLFDNNDCAAWIGVVQSGGNGTFAVRTADSSGTDADVIHIVELAGCSTLPYGSRIIVHRITTESLASGSTPSGS